MKICSICHKISATNDDHLDCKEKRRIELEAEDLKETLNERLTISGLDGDLQKEIKAILEHMMKEKKSPS